MVTQFTEESMLVEDSHIHVYKWHEADCAPKLIVLLIHGLMMHGKVYDSLACSLASEDILVIAPDLRGFGRWYHQETEKSIDYLGTIEDIGRLLANLRKVHSHASIIFAGESLGAHVARSVTALHWQMVNGLILSNPCVRPRMVAADLIPYTVSELVQSCFNLSREINLTPFASRFLASEPESLSYYVEDPMSRKSLDILELIDSMLLIGSYKPASIPSHMPVLVFRGSHDGVCTNSSFNQFISTLDSKRMTTIKCRSCGHLVLQAKRVDEEIIDSMREWLNSI